MRALPDPLRAPVERALEGAGHPGRIVRAEPLGGGCVNDAVRVDTERGERFFLKWNARAPAGMFQAEADGLRALAGARPPGRLRIPAVIAAGEPGQGEPAWLLLEHVAPGAPGRDYAERLAEGLAGLHRSVLPVGAAVRLARARGAPAWGWPRDNFIGPLPQSNEASPSWGTFWRDRRIAPQLARARARGHFAGGEGARLIEHVVEHTEELLAGVDGEPASLLHGDLWGGNVYPDEQGRPVLIDPAAYRGHREVDLAMTELFGGFPGSWPRAYDDAWPLPPAYAHHRRALYQLYYLLVHVVLFGPGYEAGCVRAAREALRGA